MTKLTARGSGCIWSPCLIPRCSIIHDVRPPLIKTVRITTREVVDCMICRLSVAVFREAKAKGTAPRSPKLLLYARECLSTYQQKPTCVGDFSVSSGPFLCSTTHTTGRRTARARRPLQSACRSKTTSSTSSQHLWSHSLQYSRRWSLRIRSWWPRKIALF